MGNAFINSPNKEQSYTKKRKSKTLVAAVSDRRIYLPLRLTKTMPERLHRLEHHHARHPIWFITACTHARAKILANKEVLAALEHFAESGPEHGAWLGAYVLMPDHLHAFVALDDQRLTLSAWMKSLKGTLSQTLRATGHPSPYWQQGFFDHVLRRSDSYAAKWHYVKENPVRAGLVTHSHDWPHQGELHPLTLN